MLDTELIKKIDLKKPSTWLATWFGCGLMKSAPGTWGTLGGLPFGIALLALGGWTLLLAGVVIIFAVGYLVSKDFEEMVGEHDVGAIVIDEVAGIWIALLPAGLNPLMIVLAFLLFRFFDIVKPWPISWCDRKFSGPFGVMFDDVVAGFFTACLLMGWHYAGIG